MNKIFFFGKIYQNTFCQKHFIKTSVEQEGSFDLYRVLGQNLHSNEEKTSAYIQGMR